MSFTVSPQNKTSSTVQFSAAKAPPAAAPAQVAAQVAAAVAPPPAEAGEVAKAEKVAPQLADLAQKAKAQREAQRKWEADKAAWEAQKSGYISLEDLKKDPLALMDKAGVTYEQLQARAMATVDPVQSKLQMLEAKLAEYENKFKSIDEGQTKATQAQQEAARKQIVFEASKISEAPEFEVLKAFGQEGLDEVAEKIINHYNETSNLLDVAEATKAVNAELTEKLKARFGSLSLFKTLTEPKVEASQPTAQANQTQTTARTLTNAMTASSNRKYSAAEKRERAIRAMRGEKLD
jgi:hypothetical protein